MAKRQITTPEQLDRELADAAEAGDIAGDDFEEFEDVDTNGDPIPPDEPYPRAMTYEPCPGPPMPSGAAVHSDPRLMSLSEVDAELAWLKARAKLLNRVRRLLLEVHGKAEGGAP
jgi:hypothetical protein